MARRGGLDLRLDPPAIARFRAALDELAYDALLRAVRGSYPLTPFPPYPEFRRRARSLPPGERLWFELLLLGRALPETAVKGALGTELAHDLQTLGVLNRRGAQLATRSIGLTSLDGRYVFASLPPNYPACRDRDLHAYIGQESYLLARFLPPDGYRSALDLCSGSGLLGVLMAGRAPRVVAIDLDPVSVMVGAFNVELNGLSDRVSTRQGDVWQPVAGERFDLIAFNSPFVPTPDGYRPVTFRDGGADGLAVLGPILDGLEAHLADDGCAVTYAEGFGDELEPFLARRLAEIAKSGGLAIDLLLLYRLSVAALVRMTAGNPRIPASAYRQLARDSGASRYYRTVIRVRRGPGRVRTIDAGRYL